MPNANAPNTATSRRNNSPERADEWLLENPPGSMVHVSDTDGAVAAEYHVVGLPTT